MFTPGERLFSPEMSVLVRIPGCEIKGGKSLPENHKTEHRAPNLTHANFWQMVVNGPAFTADGASNIHLLLPRALLPNFAYTVCILWYEYCRALRGVWNRSKSKRRSYSHGPTSPLQVSLPTSFTATAIPSPTTSFAHPPFAKICHPRDSPRNRPNGSTYQPLNGPFSKKRTTPPLSVILRQILEQLAPPCSALLRKMAE